MAEGGFDPCECIWNHETAMQRLMNLLRDSQSFCTDNECLTDPPALPNAGDGGFNFLLFTFMWMALALVLFLFRPNSLRRIREDRKPGTDRDGSNQPPLPPSVQ